MKVHWTQNALDHLVNIYEHIALNSPLYARGMVTNSHAVPNKSLIIPTEEHRPAFTAGWEKTAVCWVMTGSLPKPWGHSQETQGRSPTLDEVFERVCGKYGIERNALKKPGKGRLLSEARALAAWLVLETGCSTLAELGKLTDRDVSTLSSAAKRFQFRAQYGSNMYSIKDGLMHSIP